tara:strand:- start:111 stop:308 length:198 start_codon:yes stop_codon:yes gene_type:complete
MSLGISAYRLAQLLRTANHTIRRYETGARAIPGPVQVLMELVAKNINVLDWLADITPRSKKPRQR